MADIVKQADTRRAFVDFLNKKAETDANIVVIIPDVGFNYLDNPENKFKVLNLGVTEQSSMVIAAAMALSGMRVYYYSMINFSVFRPFEMVRNMVALHNAPVTILGVKGSSSYKFLGFSHNMVFENEDTYHLEKYMDCYLPQSNADVWNVLGESYEKNKPCYIRL